MSSSLNYEELIKKVEELEKQALRREQIEAKTTPFDNELEQRVAERTSDLREIIKLLKSEIKARKQIEQMLKTEKEKFRILTEMSPLGVSLIRGVIESKMYAGVINMSIPSSLSFLATR